MKIKIREFFLVPNLLSISRIFLIIPIVYLIRLNSDTGNYILMGLALIAALTDILDGYLSRKLNQVTDLGIVLDPIADKITLAACLIALVLYRNFPVPLVVLLIYRDVMILIFGWLGLSQTDHPIMANFWGKLNTAVMTLAGLLLIFNITNIVFTINVLIGYFTILLSGLSYAQVAERLLYKERKQRITFRAIVIITAISVVYALSGYAFI